MAKVAKLVQVKETFQIESGAKIFADYLDYSYDNSYGSSITLKGKFSSGVNNGDEVLLVATNRAGYVSSVTPPNDDELLSDWFVICSLVASGDIEPEVSYSIVEREYSFLTFAFYKQMGSSFVRTGEVPVL